MLDDSAASLAASLSAGLDLAPADLWALAAITGAAGLVRGFSGFALSAVVMALAVLILPPIALIPMCWWLEMTASLLTLRGGWRDADRGMALALILGSAVGVPVGLALTTSISAETSRLVALSVLLVLATTQLARLRVPGLASRPGLYGTGVVSGVVTGLAGIGGMVVALYVLARQAPARQMRASLMLYLFGGALVSLIMLLAFGAMDGLAVRRGLVFAVPAALGVLLGQSLFTPRFEGWYRPVSLSLLVALAGLSLVRTLA